MKIKIFVFTCDLSAHNKVITHNNVGGITSYDNDRLSHGQSYQISHFYTDKEIKWYLIIFE